jgi:3-deoxy-7-phosphoheptulonate synthase
MLEPLENSRVVEFGPLVPPRTVKAQFPITEPAAQTVLRTRHAVRDVLKGKDERRLVVIVGPCSIHDPAAALEYAGRLKSVADATPDALILVMRTYFEKPRTTIGWKGLINDPHLDDTCLISDGLMLARKTLLAVNELGVGCASELLDPVTPQYIADLLGWAAIGARTTESQTHRQMASGLSMPVGFKNGTDGGLDVAKNAMISARHSHSFLGVNEDGVTCVVKTTGNPEGHLVLRGGGGTTNYSPEDVARAATHVLEHGLARPILVDCSHDNSQKDHRQQGAVCRAVLSQVLAGQKAIMGLSLEGNLNEGKQTWKPGAPLAYGVSITDACIGWSETEELLYEAAAAARAGQAGRSGRAVV